MEAAPAQIALPARVRTDLAPWLAIAAPLALLAVAIVVTGPGLVVQDSWLALVSGREVVTHGLPAVDHLTVMASGHSWVDQQWLAQLVLYGAARIGGVGLAFALCALAVVAAFALAAHIAHRRGASPVLLLVSLGWAVVAAPWGLQMRAQALALPLFALTLWLLERRSPFLVLPVLAVWANIHGSVVVGVALVAAYAIVCRSPALFVLAPLMTFVSPYALRLPGYYRLMLLDPPFGRFIKEWQRTTPSSLTAAFFALAVCALALVVVRRHRLSVFDLVALALTLALALEAIRSLIWFALVAVALLPALATRRPGSVRFSGRPAAISTAVAVATIATALTWAVARPASSYEARLSPAVADAVRAHATAGQRVLADDMTADWLLWQVPSLRGSLGYDVRFELLTRRQIVQLLRWRLLTTGWDSALGGYSVVVDDPPHIARLIATGNWRMVARSAYAAVAVRS